MKPILLRAWARCRTLAALTATALVASHAVVAATPGWVPQRHVEFVIPGGAGGNLDAIGRPIERLWQELKLVPVSTAIVNRGGGEQVAAYTYLQQRPGDPHVVGLATPVLLTSAIMGRIPFSYTELTPIAFMMSDAYVFAVPADSPLKSGRDFVEALKQRPDSLSIAVGGFTHRIAIGLVLQAADVDIRRVKIVAMTSGTQATSVVGGHVDMTVTGVVQALPHVEAGKLRVIAVSSAKRMGGAFAAAPTWEELGYKQGTYQTWRGIVGTKGITPAQVAYWEGITRQIVENPEFRRLAEKNQWVLGFRGAAEMGKLMEAEFAETKSVMTYLGLIKQ